MSDNLWSKSILLSYTAMFLIVLIISFVSFISLNNFFQFRKSFARFSFWGNVEDEVYIPPMPLTLPEYREHICISVSTISQPTAGLCAEL